MDDATPPSDAIDAALKAYQKPFSEAVALELEGSDPIAAGCAQSELCCHNTD